MDFGSKISWLYWLYPATYDLHPISDSEHFTVKVSPKPLTVKLDNIPTLIFLLDLVISTVFESEIYSDNFLSKPLFGEALSSTINIV